MRLQIRDLAHVRPRFGYVRIWVLLRREGWLVNRKRVRRLYRLDGLQLRMRVRRRKPIALHRGPAPIPTGPTERWSMDFVHDTLADGRPFRILTVVDHWSRHSPILEAEFRMSGGNRWSGARSCPGHTSGAPLDHGGSWDGIPIASLGGLGLSAGRPTRLHSTRQIGGECLH